MPTTISQEMMQFKGNKFRPIVSAHLTRSNTTLNKAALTTQQNPNNSTAQLNQNSFYRQIHKDMLLNNKALYIRNILRGELWRLQQKEMRKTKFIL